MDNFDFEDTKSGKGSTHKTVLTTVPLRKDWARVKLGTEHKQKKLRRFQAISFLLTMVKVIMQVFP